MDSARIDRFLKARAGDLSQPAEYLRLLARQLDASGVDVQAWLHGCGLDPATLADRDWLVPVPQFRRLVLAAMRASREPALGLLVGQRMAIHHHALLGAATRQCATLREALQLLADYIALRTPLVSLRVLGRGDEVRLLCRERLLLGEIRRPVLEAIVLGLKRILDFLAPGAVRAVAFALDAPPCARLAQDVWQCEQRYRGRWTGLVIVPGLLDSPLAGRVPGDFRRAAEDCARELAQRVAHDGTVARVQALLLAHGSDGFPQLATAARLLNLSARTLHRRLQAEGSSYRQLLDELRQELAAQHQRGGRLRMAATAHALGYSDPANFRRARRRWTRAAQSATMVPTTPATEDA